MALTSVKTQNEAKTTQMPAYYSLVLGAYAIISLLNNNDKVSSKAIDLTLGLRLSLCPCCVSARDEVSLLADAKEITNSCADQCAYS